MQEDMQEIFQNSPNIRHLKLKEFQCFTKLFRSPSIDPPYEMADVRVAVPGRIGIASVLDANNNI